MTKLLTKKPFWDIRTIFAVSCVYRIYDRELLKELPRLSWEVIKEVYQAVMNRTDVNPGMIVTVQIPHAGESLLTGILTFILLLQMVYSRQTGHLFHYLRWLLSRSSNYGTDHGQFVYQAQVLV